MLHLEEQSWGYDLCAGHLLASSAPGCKSETVTLHQGSQHPHFSPSRAWAEEHVDNGISKVELVKMHVLNMQFKLSQSPTHKLG